MSKKKNVNNPDPNLVPGPVLASIGPKDSAPAATPAPIEMEVPQLAPFVPTQPLVDALMRIQQTVQNLATFCALQLSEIAKFSDSVRQQQQAAEQNTPEPPTTL